LAAFLSTFVNKVDRKGRVSVPAPWRAALAGQDFQGVVAFASLTQPALDAFGRDALEQMNRRRFDRTLEAGDIAAALLGTGEGDDLIEAIMALAHELPFDGEGRIILPKALVEHAGIGEEAKFVGRGNRFQIWAPATFDAQNRDTLARLRSRLGQGGPGGLH